MARPPKTIKPVPLNMSLDGDLAARMKEELFSEVEGKIPHGAMSKLLNQILRKHYRSEDGKAVYRRTQLAAQSPGNEEITKKKVEADLEAFLAEPAIEVPAAPAAS